MATKLVESVATSGDEDFPQIIIVYHDIKHMSSFTQDVRMEVNLFPTYAVFPPGSISNRVPNEY